MNIRIFTSATAALALLSACGSPTSPPVHRNAATAPAATSVPTTSPPRGVANFGTDTVDLGTLTVAMTRPTKYTGGYCCSQNQGPETAVSFTVTVKNNGTKPVDAGELRMQAQFGTAHLQGQSFSGVGALIGDLSGTILPGQPLTGTVGYYVPTATDVATITIIVTPAIEIDPSPAIFAGTVG
jgi:hypothetical protein